MINGIDSLVITKLTYLTRSVEIQVCVGYKYKGTPLKEMPALAEEYERVTPEYKTLPGWNETTVRLERRSEAAKARWSICDLFGFSASGNRNDFHGAGARRDDCAGGDAAGAVAVKK